MRDVDIRTALLGDALAKHANESETLILSEMSLCQGSARVDVAVINGELHGFEIKSEHDTLIRLQHQAAVYSRVFDRVTIVASGQHFKAMYAQIPVWWGVLEAVSNDSKVDLIERRPTGVNPEIDPVSLAQLLWRDEALDELKERGLSKDVERKPRKEVWQKLAAFLPVQELGAVVRKRLRARPNWRVGELRT